VLVAGVGLVFAASAGWLLAVSANRRAAPPPGGVIVGSSNVHSKDPLTPDEVATDLKIPPFSLTDQDGKTITQSVFAGKVTILDFYFTNCTLVCPVLVQVMIDQTKALAGTSVKFLSISVDPDHDTPAVIKRYGQEHNADFSRWTFARGDKQTINQIVEGGLHFVVGEDPANVIRMEGGGTMQNILHPSWFVLVGPKGEVLGIYRTDDDSEMRALTARARAAAASLK
jgi:cytochrome oxidase Cu insertion factor (SCO1/SenC/PrrC family)